MVCAKVVCDKSCVRMWYVTKWDVTKWYVTKWCVTKEAEEAAEEEEDEVVHAGRRSKNKSPTQFCGERNIIIATLMQPFQYDF